MPYIQEPSANSPVVHVRELRDDENFVLSGYERHASRCSKCADPLDVLRERRSLCDRGQQYAADLAGYIYSKGGKAYSAIDRGYAQSTLIRIPKDSRASRRLLLAVEEGLRVRPKDAKPPVIDYPSTPAAHRRHAPNPEPQTQIIERSPRTSRRRVIVYPRGSPSRGSLFEADEVDRIERRYESFRVYRPSAEHYR